MSEIYFVEKKKLIEVCTEVVLEEFDIELPDNYFRDLKGDGATMSFKFQKKRFLQRV